MSELEYGILGSVTVRSERDVEPITLSDQQRRLLGRLVVEPGARVTTDAIIDALWGEKPGKDPRNAVQVTVSSVRAKLGDSGRQPRVLVTDGDGYLLTLDPLRVDAERFKRLVRRGHDLVTTRPRVSRAMLEEALLIWRDPPFGEYGDLEWASGHARELGGMRDRAEVDLNEVRLALGDHAALEPSLRAQIARSPRDERRHGQLVRALLGCGRAAEAQLAYRDAYRELGALGSELRRIGEQAARGALLPSGPQGRTGATLRGGRPDAVVLCAVLDRSTKYRNPGLGMLSLLVDRHGGEPHLASGELLAATFDTVDLALDAARVLARSGARPARIGVHAGGISYLGDDIVGPGVARCRQFALAAHPGQVLVSADARRLAGPEAGLCDLGEQRFFDLAPGVRMFELRDADGSEHFPPPATLDTLPHNLPVQPTRFVGRRGELARLAARISGGELVTLIGPGGSGKTRLALQLAASQAQAFVDGAWFVELAAVHPDADAEGVAAAIAHQLAVRALPRESQFAALVRHLSDRVALLVIDNCEQVHTACAQLVAAVRDGCRDVCIVATSRRALRLDGERIVGVSPMAVEADDDDGMPSEAVQLLLDRAGPLPDDPSRSAAILDGATRICRAVDGFPLAIELAAAHVSTRGIEAVASAVEAMMRGDDGLGSLTSHDPRRPDRQRTIESAIDWSYRLLSGSEQAVLCRLSVFQGTFAVEQALRVAEVNDAAAGGLQTLIDCSMVAVVAPTNGVARLRLVEPIRAFALGRLKSSGGLEDAREVHAQVFWSLAVDAAPRLFGHEEQACLQMLEAEHDNLRAALAWHAEGSDARPALRLVGALWWLWFSHGHLEEGCTWVQRALKIDDEPSRERVRALRAGSHLSWWLGDLKQCEAHNVAMDSCARAIDDAWGVAWVAMGFGATAVFRDPRKCLHQFEESKRLFDKLGRHWEAGYTLHLIGGARWFAGEVRAAGEAFEEAVAIFQRLGHRSVLASVQRCAGLMAALCGNPARGAALCEEALRLSEAIADRGGSAQALNFLGAISRDDGDLDEAVRRHAEALRLAREVGDLWATCWALDGLAGVATVGREPEIAARLLAHSARLAERSLYAPSPHERALRDEHVARLQAKLGPMDFERASVQGAAMSVAEVAASALAFASRHS